MEPDTELIPIFPLQQVVLYPGVRTPLHLFEPRYRQMADEVLDADRRIAMVTVKLALAVRSVLSELTRVDAKAPGVD